MTVNEAVSPSGFSFSAFPKDDRTWEVIMYGQAPLTPIGRGIEVLFADTRWRFPGGSSEPPRTMKLLLPLGDVVGLPIGSRWRNGEAATSNWEPKVDVLDVPALSGSPTYRLGEVYPVVGEGDRPPYPLVGLRDAPVWRIPISERQVYFVPAIELIRAVFGRTTDFLKLTVEGGVDLWPTLPRRIFDLNGSGASAAPGEVTIKAYRPLDRQEAEMAARIVSNARMRNAFRQVFASTQSALRDGKPLYPETIFPFDRPTRWRVESRWTQVDKPGGWRRLVTRIHSIEAPLGFEKVVVEFPRGGEVQEEQKPRLVKRRRPSAIVSKLEVCSDRPAASNLAAVALVGGQTSHDPGFVLEHVAVGGEARHVIVEEDADGEIRVGSTAWPHGMRQAVVRVSFASTPEALPDEPRPPSELIQATRAALDRLVAKHGWRCDHLRPPSGAGVDARDGLFRYPDRHQKRPVSWSVTDEGRARRALVSHLVLPSGNIYVFDAEQRDLAGGETPEAGEQHALGVMLTPMHVVFDYETVQDLLGQHAEWRGVWRPKQLPFPTARRPRNAAWRKDIPAYARHILETIRSLEAGRAPEG